MEAGQPLPHPVFIAPLALGSGRLRVAVKDTIDVAGMRTRAGSAVFDAQPPAWAHAEVVARVLAGDARIVGKTHLHELAFGVTGINHRFGTPPNPGFPGRVPGGSSSGSAAAVAGGLADIALGTDTGGSVRIPAACCGVFGIKPTFGRISRRGVAPAQSSLDCVGVFAGTAQRLTRGMALIDPGFVIDQGDAALTLGRVRVDADRLIDAALDQALAQSGLACEEVSLPGMADAFDAGLVIINHENWQAFSHLVDHPLLGEDVRARLKAAGNTGDAAVQLAERVRARFTAAVDAALSGVDALVLPTMPDFPLTLEAAADARAAIGITRLVRPFNLSGHPAISLPLMTPVGLPAGLQLVGRKGSDAALCRIAERIAAGARQIIHS
jgi:amidase